MIFSERMKKITPSATMAINAKTIELKAKGIKVTSLAVGEPDAPAPDHVCEAVKKAVDERFCKYTPGDSIIEARQAVCNYFTRLYNVTPEPRNVILTNGGKQSLIDTMLVILNEGDDVLLPTPYWTSYPDMIRIAGGNPVLVPSLAERTFHITTEDLEKAVTPKTRMFILNSPSNPTGAAYTQEEINALLDWCLSKNIFVIADEMYDRLVYDGEPVSAIKWWINHQEHCAIINGLSKSFGAPGWRIGYTVAHNDLIKQCSKLQVQTTSHICSVMQKAVVEALNGSYDSVEKMRVSFKRRRDLAMAEISQWKGVVCSAPAGAFYLFPDVHALFTPEIPNAVELCTYLLEKARVACVPGEAFGNPNCIRLSYAVSDEVLIDALHRIREALYGK